MLEMPASSTKETRRRSCHVVKRMFNKQHEHFMYGFAKCLFQDMPTKFYSILLC